MKLDALDHPKTFDFAARLGVELPTAIGHLELLWAFTGKQAPQGNLGKWPDGAIARACYWMGRPEVFVQALRESGFLDADEVHRLTIHDWREHAPRWVKSKLKTLGLSFVDSSTGDTSRDASPDIGGDTGGDSKGSVVKGSEGKRREGKARASQADELRELDEIRSAYPRGSGSPDWLQGEREYRRARDEGDSHGEIVAGVRRYADYCTATKAIGTQFVLAPRRFFAERKYREPWVKPATKSDQRLGANLSAAEEFMRRTEVQ